MHACMHDACMHACIHTYTHARMHVYVQSFIHTYVHTYIRTDIYSYIYTYRSVSMPSTAVHLGEPPHFLCAALATRTYNFSPMFAASNSPTTEGNLSISDFDTIELCIQIISILTPSSARVFTFCQSCKRVLSSFSLLHSALEIVEHSRLSIGNGRAVLLLYQK